jgi:maltooligosyltrehalose trehalohydrolase
MSMLLCLTPYTPMLFMGQEWAAATPFLYFTDHAPGLGRLVSEGRRREFAGFPEFGDNGQLKEIPDPQAASTFEDSKLKWDEAKLPEHAGIRALYRACLHLRLKEPAFRPQSRDGWDVRRIGPGLGCIIYQGAAEMYLLLFHLWPNGESRQISFAELPLPAGCLEAKVMLTSAAQAFGGAKAVTDAAVSSYVFEGAECVVIRAGMPPES